MPRSLPISLPWPFKRSGSPRPIARGTIEAIYGMIVAQAREPVFYRAFNVPDTVDGRFDMVLLHLWIVLSRLRGSEQGTPLSQALFNRFVADMDANLREMGVGDLTVPKRMKAFGEAFYGRSAAYDIALSESTEALGQAISKNILNGRSPEQGRRLADYARAAIELLAGLDDTKITAAAFRFPPPAPFVSVPDERPV